MSVLETVMENLTDILIKIIDGGERDFRKLHMDLTEIALRMPSVIGQFTLDVNRVFTFFNAAQLLQIWLSGLFQDMSIEETFSVLARTYVVLRQTQVIEPTAWLYISPPGVVKAVAKKPRIIEEGTVLTIDDLFEALGGAFEAYEFMKKKCGLDVAPEFTIENDVPKIYWYGKEAGISRFVQLYEFTNELVKAVDNMIKAVFVMLTTDHETRLKTLPQDVASLIKNQIPKTKSVELFASTFIINFVGDRFEVFPYCWVVNERKRRGRLECHEIQKNDFMGRIDSIASKVMSPRTRAEPPAEPRRITLTAPGTKMPWGFMLDATGIWEKIGGYRRVYAILRTPVPVYYVYVPSILDIKIPVEKSPCYMFLSNVRTTLEKAFSDIFSEE